VVRLQMKSGQRLVFSFVVIAGVVAAAGAVGILYNIEVLSDVDRMFFSQSDEVKSAAEAAYQIEQLHTNTSELLLPQAGRSAEQYSTASKAIARQAAQLRQFNSAWQRRLRVEGELSGQGRERQELFKAFESFKTKTDALPELINRTLQIRQDKSLAEAASFFEDKVEPLFVEAGEIAEVLEQSTRDHVFAETKPIRKVIKSTVWVSVVLSIVGVLAVIVMRRRINRTISISVSDSRLGGVARRQRWSAADDGQKAAETGRTVSSANAAPDDKPEQEDSAQARLQRHIKQLNCFYDLSKLVEQSNISLDQIFEKSAELIRSAYQDPAATCVRITFDGIQYKTGNFEKSELSQCTEIKVRGEKGGSIEAYYRGAKTSGSRTPFLKEEGEMLHAVGEHLGRIADGRQKGEKLQLFRNLIDRSNDCIFVIDSKWGRLLDVNDRACETLGYKREELHKMTVKDIDGLAPNDSVWQQHVQELEHKGDIIVEGTHRRKDGTKFSVETSLKLVSHRKEKYIIAITRDITERKRAEENQARLIDELKTINEKVKRVNQELKDFAYIVSHDLKAPLRGIKTLADWISTDYADKIDEKGKEQMGLLLTRVGRMHNLINGVLQYSRVGRVREKKVKADLNELLPEVIDMVAPPENIEVTVEGRLPVIECEKTGVIHIFENLLSNAIKYMDKPRGQIRIGCVEDEVFWKFSVGDNGPGIEEKYFDKIFRIFQTLSARDDFESTGVGLSVVKKIVALSGGRIWVESEPGRGSTFYFTLPKSKREVSDAKPKLKADIAC